MKFECPVCNADNIVIFIEVSGYNYYECNNCEVIFISPDILTRIDNGEFLINYSNKYWKEELYAAR